MPPAPNSRSGNQSDSTMDESVTQNNNEESSGHEKKKIGILERIPGYIFDSLALFAIVIMLIWPWVFYRVVSKDEGVIPINGFADVITANPHATTYFVTYISSIIASIVGALFSYAIVRFAQEWITSESPKSNQTFYLVVLLALRHRSWPWGWKDRVRYMTSKNRRWPVFLVFICLLAFPHLVSGPTSILTPGPVPIKGQLSGTEIDFSSTAADCIDWLEANLLNLMSNNCTLQTSSDNLTYTTCLGEHQLGDVLESVRTKILNVSGQVMTLSQLGQEIQFLGTTHGVYPQFTNYSIYAIDLQGLNSQVSCSYNPTSPISISALNGSTTALASSATCAELGEIEVLTNMTQFVSANSDNFLAYWACQSAPNGTQAPSYSIYLRGLNAYQSTVGNMTCTVSPLQLANYSVIYQAPPSQNATYPTNYQVPQSSTGNFFVNTTFNSVSPLAFSSLMNYTLISLGNITSTAQGFQSNLIAELVNMLTNTPYNPNSTPETSYAQMIQSILEYEASYIRFLYSVIFENSNTPASCNRPVTGSTDFLAIGWFVTTANVGFLMPMTLINLTALVALIYAMILAQSNRTLSLPLGPRPVTHDQNIDGEGEIPDEWRHKIAFQPSSGHSDVKGHNRLHNEKARNG